VPLFVLSRLLSSLWVLRTGSASDWYALQEALYKCIDTIQYNTVTVHWKLHIDKQPIICLFLSSVQHWEVLNP